MTSEYPSDSRLTGASEWHASRCACGQITLRLGAVRIEFSPEEFSQLHRLVEQAMTEFDIMPSHQSIHQVRTIMQ